MSDFQRTKVQGVMRISEDLCKSLDLKKDRTGHSHCWTDDDNAWYPYQGYRYDEDIPETGDETAYCCQLSSDYCPQLGGQTAQVRWYTNLDTDESEKSGIYQRGVPLIRCLYDVSAFKSKSDLDTFVKYFPALDPNDKTQGEIKDETGTRLQVSWDPYEELKKKVLPQYCQQTVTTCPVMQIGGGKADPTCSRMVSTDLDDSAVCGEWKSTESTSHWNDYWGANAVMMEYCGRTENADRNECRCINRGRDSVYRTLKVDNPFIDSCWWRDCQVDESDMLLPWDMTQKPTDGLAVCPQTICLNIVNVWDNQGVVVNWDDVELYTCCTKDGTGCGDGSSPPSTVARQARTRNRGFPVMILVILIMVLLAFFLIGR